MSRRRALPLLLLALVAGGAWLLRDNGILLGRDSEGPLRLGNGIGGMTIEPGMSPQIDDVARVEGGPIEIESTRPELISPGLELLGPVAGELREEGLCSGCEGPWPPPRSSKLARLADDDVVITGFRAREPGVYHVHGIRYRYRRGVRRFDEVDGTEMCFFVDEDQDRDGCVVERPLRSFEGLAEIGGPADYRDGRFRRWMDEVRGEGPVFGMRDGGTLEFDITISNLSDEDRVVTRLDLGRRGDPAYRDGLEPLPPDPPRTTIPAGGSKQVRVRARYTDCEAYTDRQSRTFEAIEAGDDDVELSVPVTVSGPCR